MLDTPPCRVPAVNIGRRQYQRVRGSNDIDVGYNFDEITEGINKAMSKKFKDYLENNCINPYGDGHSAEKILDILLSTRVDEKLLIKNLTY